MNEVSQVLMFCLTKKKKKIIFILAVFQFPAIFKGVIRIMGVLKKGKET